ncbi:MAG: hypothetical protein ACRDRK_25990 [Pseudonocardia sp.]
MPGTTAVRAGDLIGLLLKKRLLSSPAAFARTLAAHRDTVARAGEPTIDGIRASTPAATLPPPVPARTVGAGTGSPAGDAATG